MLSIDHRWITFPHCVWEPFVAVRADGSVVTRGDPDFGGEVGVVSPSDVDAIYSANYEFATVQYCHARYNVGRPVAALLLPMPAPSAAAVAPTPRPPAPCPRRPGTALLIPCLRVAHFTGCTMSGGYVSRDQPRPVCRAPPTQVVQVFNA